MAAPKEHNPAKQESHIATRSTQGARLKVFMALAALLLAFAGLVALMPLKTAIQLGGDEGFELAKATLGLKGFKLYTDVWNDQPPLHTFVLTETLKHISPSIVGPRLISVGFAMLLLSSVFLISRRVSGLATATLATALVIVSPGFLTLGASCMLEVPCVATAFAALCVLLLGNHWHWRLSEFIAAALFGIACEIKLIGMVLLPIAALIVWLNQQNKSAYPGFSFRSIKRIIASLFIVGVSTAASFIAIDWLIENGAFIKHFQQTWASHFGGTNSLEYGSPKDHAFDWSILLKNWDATVPALFGMLFCAMQVRQKPLLALPMAWIVFDLVLFGTHTPWWSYYYVHIAPPLCWCAAIAIVEILKLANWRRKQWAFGVTIAFLLGSLWWSGTRMVLQIQGARHTPQTYNTLALTEIQRFKPFTKFLYADQAIYSFHSGIPLIPDLAVVMLKRLWSGEMTNAKIKEEMETVKPELILLANDTRVMPFQQLLQTEYRLVYQDSIHRLYALKSIANKAEY